MIRVYYSRYYHNLNTIGKIKSGLILIGGLGNLYISASTNEKQEPLGAFTFMPILFFGIALPLILKFNSFFYDVNISKPAWNDNPFNRNSPLISFDFGGTLFLTAGICQLVGRIIGYMSIDLSSLFLINAGIGVYLGIFLSLKWLNNNN